MAKKKRQSRRSISVNGLTYARLKNYCDRFGMSVSGELERIIHHSMDNVAQPYATAPLPKQEKPKPVVENDGSQYFTF